MAIGSVNYGSFALLVLTIFLEFWSKIIDLECKKSTTGCRPMLRSAQLRSQFFSQAAEQAKQKKNPNSENNNKVSQSSSSAGCEKKIEAHNNDADVVLSNTRLLEERQKRENAVTNVKEEKKPAQRRKVEEQKRKQPEALDEGCSSRKKQSHASQDVTVSRQGSRETCNGKETRRKSEQKSEKKRQESVSPDPNKFKKSDAGKSENGGRLPQKKQGKKKKKVSLGKAFKKASGLQTFLLKLKVSRKFWRSAF